jgi:hypothetical protein
MGSNVYCEQPCSRHRKRRTVVSVVRWSGDVEMVVPGATVVRQRQLSPEEVTSTLCR